jgi:hypothetical protein
MGQYFHYRRDNVGRASSCIKTELKSPKAASTAANNLEPTMILLKPSGLSALRDENLLCLGSGFFFCSVFWSRWPGRSDFGVISSADACSFTELRGGDSIIQDRIPEEYSWRAECL